MWKQVSFLLGLCLNFLARSSFRHKTRPTISPQQPTFASVINQNALFALRDWSVDAVYHWIRLIPELDESVAQAFLSRDINGRILNILNEDLLFDEFSYLKKYQLALLYDEIRLQKENDSAVERQQLLEAESREQAIMMKRVIILLGNGLQYRLIFYDNESLRERLREKGIMGLVAEDESRPAFMVDRYEDIKNGGVYRVQKMEEEERLDRVKNFLGTL